MAWNDVYVSSAASGGGDGSEGDPYSIAECDVTAGILAPGDRVNIISDGTYALAGDITFANGANESPIWYRGYNSSIGDLDDIGRASATSALTHTNFPIIDGGALYTVSFGQGCWYSTVHFTSTRNAATVLGAQGSIARRCRFANTATSGSACAGYTQANYAGAFDCDGVISSSGSSAACFKSGRSSLFHCRAWNDTTKAGQGFTSTGLQDTIANCIAFHLDEGIYGGGLHAYHNTIYDCVTGISLGQSVRSSIIYANIIYSMSGYAIGGTDAGSSIIDRNAMGALASGRIDTSGLGSVIQELNGIVLTADPFVDAANEDFRLNNTAGGGVSCRKASLVWGDLNDVGAVQSLNRILRNSPMSGGFQ